MDFFAIRFGPAFASGTPPSAELGRAPAGCGQQATAGPGRARAVRRDGHEHRHQGERNVVSKLNHADGDDNYFCWQIRTYVSYVQP